jgi:hypothetical protein
MNPMAYRGPGQTLVGYEPPPAWAPPTPEQESLREPWIDPTTAFAGGFGANIMRRGLMGALRGGTAAAVADYPLGLATAGVENIDPRLAMPFNLIGGMASGASFERGLENAMAGKAHPVRTARRALGNAMGQAGSGDWSKGYKGLDPKTADELFPAPKGKKPWEMTLLEWENYAPFGRLIRDKGRYIPGEDSAKTAFKIGELNGYSPRDIAHYYYKNRSGYHQYIADAIKNGKNVPDEIIAKVFKDKAIPKWTKLRDKNAKKKLGR